jgi:hypothetical protein
VIDFCMQNLQNFFQFHLFQRILALQVKLCMNNKLNHSLRPRDASQIKAIAKVDLLSPRFDVVENAKTVSFLLLVLDTIRDILLAVDRVCICAT